MKPVLWLLLASALAFPFATTAAADDLPIVAGCDVLDTSTPFVKAHTNPDCTVSVHVNHDLNCLWGHSSTTYTVGPVQIVSYWCTEPADGPSAACPAADVPLFVEGSRLELRADCTGTLYVTPDIMCVGAWVDHDTTTIGPLTVDRTYCTWPMDDPF